MKWQRVTPSRPALACQFAQADRSDLDQHKEIESDRVPNGARFPFALLSLSGHAVSLALESIDYPVVVAKTLLAGDLAPTKAP
jgi:hypothetical protein